MNRMIFEILFIKSKIKQICEKQCDGSSLNGIYINKIKFFNSYLAVNIRIHYITTTLKMLRANHTTFIWIFYGF